MKDSELTLSYSDLQKYLEDPQSPLHKRIAQVQEAEDEELQVVRGGRVDFLADEPLDFNYDDARVDQNHRRDEDYWEDEIPKRYTLEEKIEREYNPSLGIEWVN